MVINKIFMNHIKEIINFAISNNYDPETAIAQFNASELNYSKQNLISSEISEFAKRDVINLIKNSKKKVVIKK